MKRITKNVSLLLTVSLMLAGCSGQQASEPAATQKGQTVETETQTNAVTESTAPEGT